LSTTCLVGAGRGVQRGRYLQEEGKAAVE
jgi:hypothetical protein